MHTRGEWRRQLWRFVLQNQHLLWLLGLLLCGVQIGCLVFHAAWKPLGTALADLLDPVRLQGGFSGALRQFVAYAGPHFLLLLLLFLLGFSACGAPPALVVPLFFGAGIGLSEAYHFARGIHGVGYVALIVLPPTLLTATALLIACAQAVRFSAQLCRVMLPHPTIGSRLWQEFKLYLARFLLCVGLLAAAGVLDTVLRLIFIHYFV